MLHAVKESAAVISIEGAWIYWAPKECTVITYKALCTSTTMQLFLSAVPNSLRCKISEAQMLARKEVINKIPSRDVCFTSQVTSLLFQWLRLYREKTHRDRGGI